MSQTRAAGTEITEFVAGFENVDLAVSYWTLGDPPPLRGSGGDNALVMAHVAGNDTEAIERADELVDALEDGASAATPSPSTPVVSPSSTPRSPTPSSATSSSPR